MIAPTGAATFAEAMRMGTEVYHNLAKIIKAKYGVDSTNVGDEGGFAPSITDAYEGLDLLVEAIAKAGNTGRVQIAMDVAASEFCVEGMKYDLKKKATANDGSGVRDGAAMCAM